MNKPVKHAKSLNIFSPANRVPKTKAYFLLIYLQGGGDMEIVTMNQVKKTPLDNPIFTGSAVTIQELLPDSQEFLVNIVNFGKGVRNKFHTHSTEQILIVTTGKGIVATDQEERIVTPGDIVLIPAGEKHWHGATPDSDLSHIYVMRKGSVLKQLE
jgi:quercetin dioxygenase-like cupin family protein